MCQIAALFYRLILFRHQPFKIFSLSPPAIKHTHTHAHKASPTFPQEKSMIIAAKENYKFYLICYGGQPWSTEQTIGGGAGVGGRKAKI